LSFRLTLSEKADKDLTEASVWYERKAEGLGTRFKEVIGRKLRLIEQYPERYPVRKANFREAPVRIFPYLIIYKLYQRKKEIVVYSIFHSKRNPKTKYKRK
jgi:plasmid stabilization system protein ParE